MLFVEALAAAVLGLGALWLVLRPLVHPTAFRASPVFEPVDPEETPTGIALAALKEIEFDRETGKLSDADYEALKATYTASALEALRREEQERALGSVGGAELRPVEETVSGVRCPQCGPRPEPDATFCSHCGRPLPKQAAA